MPLFFATSEIKFGQFEEKVLLRASNKIPNNNRLPLISL